MNEEITGVVELAGSVPADLSIWYLVRSADIIVQIVMLVLVVASVMVWAIMIDKWARMRNLRTRAGRFEEAFWSGGSLEDLYERIGNRPRDPLTALFAAAMREWRRSTAKGIRAGETSRINMQQRIERVMHVTLAREMEKLERNMTFLASVGSAAPFIGLFGTVWGIMNAFQSIAAANNTSLAVVAPGIAEALFATALGLLAAIPAVVGYNKLSSDLGRYANRLEGFASDFQTIISRQLDDAKAA